MENQFVPYKEALQLKELGFNEPCFKQEWQSTKPSLESKISQVTEEDYIGIPLYQQAFDWFRNRPNNDQFWPIETWIQPFLSSLPRQSEAFYWQRGETVSVGKFNTYEEAQLELLKAVIYLVKKESYRAQS